MASRATKRWFAALVAAGLLALGPTSAAQAAANLTVDIKIDNFGLITQSGTGTPGAKVYRACSGWIGQFGPTASDNVSIATVKANGTWTTPAQDQDEWTWTCPIATYTQYTSYPNNPVGPPVVVPMRSLYGTATCAANGLASLTGKAGPGHLIQIRDVSWKILAKATVDAAGRWSASNVAGLCAGSGTKWAIIEEANAGKQVDVLAIAVAGPAAAKLTATATCTNGLASLTGTAGPGHLLQIRNAAWTILAKATADATGKWSASNVAGLCAVGATNNVIVEEANAGKRVDLMTVTAAGTSATSKLTATVTARNVSTGEISLSGTAGPGNLIQIRDAAWNIKARATANATGKWAATGVAGLVPTGQAGQIIVEEAKGGARVGVITVNVAK